MIDLISRQKAIEAIVSQEAVYADDAIDILRSMPITQSKPCEDAVSRQRLLSDLKELIAVWKKYPVMAERIEGVEAAVGYVELIPSAQPEIIRCKDCKYYKANKYDGKLACHYVIGGTVIRNPNDFCSRAERRTDD